jgi:nitroimidazol reductase NimA-like FMN-containing flavoprotein (pyridoxamine 5'-phosphate oxidase superfamily)
MSTGSAPEILETSTCWSLLRTQQVGRLAAVVDGAVDIFPVNFVVDHGTVVFRTAAGTKLTAALGGAAVAFEADGTDDEGNAWSVVLRGPARERRGHDEALETAELPLFPWHGAAKPHFVRITPDSVSGRRFPMAERSQWTSVFTEPDG